jgi:hypothetical protein
MWYRLEQRTHHAVEQPEFANTKNQACDSNTYLNYSSSKVYTHPYHSSGQSSRAMGFCI